MSVSLADFLLGIVGNWIARHGDPANNSLAAVIVERLRDGQPSLPPNHDVSRACRSALQQALAMLAQALDIAVARPRNLVEAFAHRRNEQGRWRPMLEWWHTEEGEWFDEFAGEIQSDEALDQFHLPLTNAPSLNQAIRTLPDAELEAYFQRALRDWIDRRVQRGKCPAVLEEYLRDGWPIDSRTPAVRITFYQAWCLFLQDHLKKDPNVFRILTADWLASIDAKLSSMAFTPEQLANEIVGHLQSPLGEHKALLVDVLQTVERIHDDVGAVAVGQGTLMLLVTEFRQEVGENFAQLRSLLIGLGGQLAEIGAVTARSDQKLDTLQQHGTRIIGLLEQVLAHDREPVTMPVPGARPVTRRIDASRLLGSDGAARFDKLIGRSHEKGMLTRAWRDATTNVVVFVAWGGVGKTSLVIDWICDFQNRDWEGVDAFFDWTFYSQGMKDQSSASSSLFLDAALRHFGDPATADTNQSAEDKARRLADLVRAQRTLLVLDGLEPLQHPRKPGHDQGRLRDPGILTLVHALAATPWDGLCVITTREPVIDLKRYQQRSVKEHSLQHLHVRDAAELLHATGAQRAGAAPIESDDQELLAAAKELRGHAFTLQLLGGYLRKRFDGDIRQRNRVDWGKVFEQQQEGHVFNMMEAYEQWFLEEGDRGRRQLSVLRIMGLFDREADAGCVAALRQAPVIEGVTDGLAEMGEAEWRTTVTELSDQQLVFRDPATGALDAHPLIREYFAEQLKENSLQAFRAAHSRLFDHLCETAPERTRVNDLSLLMMRLGMGASASEQLPTLADLQPLYQAVTHGCLAGRHQEACEEVYIGRILRGTGSDGFYSSIKLGATEANLGAVAAFFDERWSKLSPNLSEPYQGWLLNEVGYGLLAVGRLAEALVPMRTALDRAVTAHDWKNAAIVASNVSQLEVKLGKLTQAITDGRHTVEFASRLTGEWTILGLTTAADSLHQAGQAAEAKTIFAEAERMQVEQRPEFPVLPSSPGFWFVDLILVPAERAAWRAVAERMRAEDESFEVSRPPKGGTPKDALASCNKAERRGRQTLELAAQLNVLLDIGLDRLTLARAALYRAILTDVAPLTLRKSVADALAALSKANSLMHLPSALLTAAFCEVTLEQNPDIAKRHLDEAEQLAERGPMPLYQADVHLHRARLFRDRDELDKAGELIRELGYGRRYEELEDAEATAEQW